MISVLLPCFNGEKTIKNQLDALTQQTWTGDWEVIVSNNGSTDNSMKIVEQFYDRLPGLKIVEAYTPPEPRLGAYHSYNVAMKEAKGDVFVLCEADDEVNSGWLAAMEEALKTYEFVVARMEYRKLNPEWMLPEIGQSEQENGLCNAHDVPYEYAFGCTFGFRRSVYEKIGEFSTEFPFVFDTEYCWRVQEAGIKIHFTPEAVVHYRLRDTANARYAQGKNWGEDFTMVKRFYGQKTNFISLIKAYISVIKYSIQGAFLWILLMVGRPNAKKRLSDWAWGMGWLRGNIKGILRPLPAKSAG